MKKGHIHVLALLLTACLMLTGCGTGSVSPASAPGTERAAGGEETETKESVNAEGGVYSYEVGGTTLKLRTKVEDYITAEGYFRYKDLAAELGWYSVDKTIPTKTMVYGDELFIGFWGGGAEIISYIFFGVLKSVEPWKEKFECQVEFVYDDLSNVKKYRVDGPEPMIERFYVSFDEIVVTAYILENYMNSGNESFLEEYFERPAVLRYKVYE